MTTPGVPHVRDSASVDDPLRLAVFLQGLGAELAASRARLRMAEDRVWLTAKMAAARARMNGSGASDVADCEASAAEDVPLEERPPLPEAAVPYIATAMLRGPSKPGSSTGGKDFADEESEVQMAVAMAMAREDAMPKEVPPADFSQTPPFKPCAAPPEPCASIDLGEDSPSKSTLAMDDFGESQPGKLRTTPVLRRREASHASNEAVGKPKVSISPEFLNSVDTKASESETAEAYAYVNDATNRRTSTQSNLSSNPSGNPKASKSFYEENMAVGGDGTVWKIWNMTDDDGKQDDDSGGVSATSECFMGPQTSLQMSIKLQEVMKTTENRYQNSSAESLTRIWTEEEDVHKRCYVNHSGWLCFVWDLLGGLVIAYDVIMIPMAVFSLRTTSMDWVLTSYWTMDLVMRFFISYELKGVLITRNSQIAQHYLRTWFVMDFSALALDWIFSVTSLNQGFGIGLSRSWHIIRLARIARTVARIAKVVYLCNNFFDRIRSEQLLLMFKIMLGAFMMCVWTHYMGCYWYFCANFGNRRGLTSWVDTNDYTDEGEASMYLRAVHWAVAQSGHASSDIFPTSYFERLYACGSAVFWLVVVQGFTAHLVTWFLQLQESRHEHNQQALQIRQYLIAHGVSIKLTNRILRYFRLNYTSSSRYLQEPDIAFFKNLSPELRTRMHHEVYNPVIAEHPLFRRYSDLTELGSAAICHLATKGRYYDGGADVFAKADEAKEMIFVRTGRLEYYHGESLVPEVLEAGNWITEAVLWQRWAHCGYLVVSSISEIVTIEATELHTLIVDCDKMGWPVDPIRKYAQMVVGFHSKARKPSDIWLAKHVETLCDAAFADAEPHHWYGIQRFRDRQQITAHLRSSIEGWAGRKSNQSNDRNSFGMAASGHTLSSMSSDELDPHKYLAANKELQVKTRSTGSM